MKRAAFADVADTHPISVWEEISMRAIGTWTVIFVLGTSHLHAQQATPQRAYSTIMQSAPVLPIKLGRARGVTTPWQGTTNKIVARQIKSRSEDVSSYPFIRVVRGQAPDLSQPPPPPPPPPSSDLQAPLGANEPYNCGMATEPAASGGFFKSTWDKTVGFVKEIPTTVVTIFQGPTLFQSDHTFDYFSSPVSNPFYAVDPRSLTEIRPVFIWQKTPSGSFGFAGGNNFFFGFNGSVALTPNISVVLHKLGWTFINPKAPAPGFTQNGNFSEIHLGPEVTFLRNETTRTVMAGGLGFEIPAGSNSVFQNTGTLSLRPYFSLAQNFFRTSYGSFNFMNTTGYAFGTGNARSDFFYSSFHLDFDIGNQNRFYPMVELNWFAHTKNGTARGFNFEGADMFQFGSTAVSGLHELSIAFGGRIKFTEAIHAGIAAEFDILGGNRRLNDFRMTADIIFRY